MVEKSELNFYPHVVCVCVCACLCCCDLRSTPTSPIGRACLETEFCSASNDVASPNCEKLITTTSPFDTRTPSALTFRSPPSALPFQILLALSWLMAKAMLFPANEQACILSPVPAPPPPPKQQQQQHLRREESAQTSGHHQQQQTQQQHQQERYLSPGHGGHRLPPPPPPPFPRDICDAPEVLRRSIDAFSAAVFGSPDGQQGAAAAKGRRGGVVTAPPLDWGGAAGKQEAERMGEGAAKECERLARALGAAREIMCCYGRLEAELRIVEVGLGRGVGGVGGWWC